MTSANDLVSTALHALSSHYPPAAGEFMAAAENYRGRVTKLIEHIKRTENVRTPVPVYDVKTFLGRVLPELLKARRFEELAAGSGSPTAVNLADRPSLGDELHTVVESWAGAGHAADALIKLQTATRDDLAAELATVEKGLARFREPLPDRAYIAPWSVGNLPGWAPRADVFIYDIKALLAKKRDLTARVEHLAADGQAKPKKAAAFVGKVIDAAGGRDFIASRIREASLVRGSWFGGDSASGDLVTAETLFARSETALKNLGPEAITPAPDSYAAKLSEQAKDAAELVDRLKAVIDTRRKTGVAALIEKACAGDADAREAICVEVASYSKAFPDGFAESLIFAMPAVNFDALALELVKLTPVHEREVVDVSTPR